MNTNNSKLYLFFTSLMFLFAPLSAGISFIYFDGYEDFTHFQGLVINLVFIAIMALAIYILKERKVLALPNIKESKHLLFGLLSNILIYFYVFQYSLEIQRLMSIYLVVFLILILYFFIIDKKTIIKELWILNIWLLFMDTLHYQSFYNNVPASYMLGDVGSFFVVLLYFSIPLVGLGLYIYNMIGYKVIDTFTLIAIGIVSISTLSFFDVILEDYRFIATLYLILPFVILSDLITMLIYKRFNPLKIAFYIRLYAIFGFILFYAQSGYFKNGVAGFAHETLFEMIGIIYVAIIANLIVFLFKKNNVMQEKLIVEDVIIEETVETDNSMLNIDLSTLNVTTLKALAKAKGIVGYTNLEKDELIDLLK